MSPKRHSTGWFILYSCLRSREVSSIPPWLLRYFFYFGFGSAWEKSTSSSSSDDSQMTFVIITMFYLGFSTKLAHGNKHTAQILCWMRSCLTVELGATGKGILHDMIWSTFHCYISLQECCLWTQQHYCVFLLFFAPVVSCLFQQQGWMNSIYHTQSWSLLV